MNNHQTELVWYENGQVYTQREQLQRQWQRAVSDDEAVEYVRKQQFIRSFLAYAQKNNA